jgi:hypothetical protein
MIPRVGLPEGISDFAVQIESLATACHGRRIFTEHCEMPAMIPQRVCLADPVPELPVEGERLSRLGPGLGMTTLCVKHLSERDMTSSLPRGRAAYDG